MELYWWPKLLPHLTGLRRQFTSYQLQQDTALRSAYSWRLLELLMRFESTGWAKYSIEDFCTAMDATAKQRENFANIRRKIIDPAVNDPVAPHQSRAARGQRAAATHTAGQDAR